MRALLVYPEFPATYWGFQHSLPLTGKRATLPPLGLISLAALLPEDWDLRLVDLNVERLFDEQLLWAEVVMVGGMRIQVPSIQRVLARARALGRRTVVGGPAPTTSPGEFVAADVVFQGEVEGRIDELVAAVAAQGGPCVLAAAPDARPDMSLAPVPRYDLLDLDRYASVSLQYSRGCPYTCEFCDIIELFGRVPRVKSPAQVLAELDSLYDAGYRGSLFFVDDNFIGNRREVEKLLPEMARWQRTRGHPFELYTEASVNLASDEELLRLTVDAGFSAVFLGIETPSTAALRGAGKAQNLKLDLREAVDRLTRAGIEVMGGFIVGFDQDGPDAFDAQRAFLHRAPIPMAMVGILLALPGTALWRRLESEGRLRGTSDGDAFGPPNFDPAMDERTLLEGYARLLADIYSVDAYYDRCEAYVDRAPPPPGRRRVTLREAGTLMRTLVRVGIESPRRRRFWRLLGRALVRAPWSFAWAVEHAVKGEHLIRFTAEEVLPRLRAAVAEYDARSQSPARQVDDAPRSVLAAATIRSTLGNAASSR